MLNFILGNDFIMNYVLGTIITALIGWGAVMAKQHLNMQIDEKRKVDLHSGLMTLARVVIARFGSSLSATPEKITDVMVAEVIAGAKLSVPQAMAHFDADGKGRSAITNIATSKIQEAVNEVKIAKKAETVQVINTDPRHVTNRT